MNPRKAPTAADWAFVQALSVTGIRAYLGELSGSEVDICKCGGMVVTEDCGCMTCLGDEDKNPCKVYRICSTHIYDNHDY